MTKAPLYATVYSIEYVILESESDKITSRSIALQTYWHETRMPCEKARFQHFNPLKTKGRLLYLKTQFIPRSKHFSSWL